MRIADGRSAAVQSRRRGAKLSRLARRLAAHAISLAGLVCVVVVVYLAVVLGIGHIPSSEQTTLLVFSMIAAGVTALVYPPIGRRVSEFASRLLDQERSLPDEVLEAFRSRLTMEISLDELLLQLAESLRKALYLETAEVWTGAGVLLARGADPETAQLVDM